MNANLQKFFVMVDTEPSGGQVMAHVLRLEAVVEKLAGFGLDEILAGAQPAAPKVLSLPAPAPEEFTAEDRAIAEAARLQNCLDQHKAEMAGLRQQLQAAIEANAALRAMPLPDAVKEAALAVLPINVAAVNPS